MDRLGTRESKEVFLVLTNKITRHVNEKYTKSESTIVGLRQVLQE